MTRRDLTLVEAAAQLGVRPDTLRQRIRAGRLTARKIGRDWVVTPAEIARYRRVSLGRRRSRAVSSP